MPRRHIVFQAFSATPITPVDCCRRSQPRTDPLFSGIHQFCGIHRFVQRNPSVCSAESIGLYVGKHWFPREKPMVYSVETTGFPWGAHRPAVGSATAKRMGLDAKQAEKNYFDYEHIWKSGDGYGCKTGRKSYISASFCQKSVTLPPYLSPHNTLFSSHLNHRWQICRFLQKNFCGIFPLFKFLFI